MKKITTICLCIFSLSVFSQHIVDKNVGDFNEIKVFDLIEVNLIKSNENKVLIKGWNVDDIQVVNKNGVLKVRMQLDRKFQGEHTFVEVYYEHLDVIDGNEGARITFNELVKQDVIELRAQEGAKITAGLDVEYANIRAVTGGIVEASGLALEQQVRLNTGGVFEGRQLRTEYTKLRITAAGEAEVYAENQIDISVKAGGDVHVYGNPKIVNKSTLAGGRIYIEN